jgi:hypothetical protein
MAVLIKRHITDALKEMPEIYHTASYAAKIR